MRGIQRAIQSLLQGDESNKSQRGFMLLEILVGVALLGTIGTALIHTGITTLKATKVSEEKVAALSLARSQIEYVKVQDYIVVADYDPNNPVNRYELIDIPTDLVVAGYSVEISPPETIINITEGGFELQSLSVAVKHNNQTEFQLLAYKLGR